MSDRRKPMVVAIDGPAGAGKSTVARAVARTVGFSLVDTGAIYRVVALQAQRAGVAADDEAGLTRLADRLDLRFSPANESSGTERVWLVNEDVTALIRTPEISDLAAQISARPLVRRALVELQRRLAGAGDAVLEGRDIGTVIYPDAALKFFLSASLKERARRRHEELLERGQARSLDEVTQDIERRDAWDAQRAIAPLKAAADAQKLDSTQMTPDEVVQTIVTAIHAKLEGRRLADETEQASVGDVKRLFEETLPLRLKRYAEHVGAVGGTYTFVVTGPGGGSWQMDLDARPPKLAAGHNEAADCRVTMTSQVLLAVLQQRLHPQKAFMQGQILVQGDVTLALRLGALLA